MDPYIALLAGAGGMVLLTAWLPMLLKELPLSLPIICVALGAGLFALPGMGGAAPHPGDHLDLVERLTEMVVIVALTGCGLKLDRPLGFGFSPTWRLLVIAMPLTIVALAWLAHALLGVGLAAALLIAAALAPTDPVLASDVQVGPPGQGEEDEIRFALTSEAGLNDGLAFPFVNLAIALAAIVSLEDGQWFLDWLAVDVIWKLAAGVAIGWLIGRGLGWLAFRLPNRAALSRTGDGFVALGITLVSYSVTEMAQGYGFLAVFVTAVTFRSVERHHDYHGSLHDFIEQLERLLMMALLFLFGASLTGGGLLAGIDHWTTVLFALLTIFVVRPVAGWLSLLGGPEPPGERATIAFYGIRGVGSFYYLAYGLGHEAFEATPVLWSAVSLVVLISIFLHGATVTPVMRRLDHARPRAAEP
jgi:sodium/hydrogen antiporter